MPTEQGGRLADLRRALASSGDPAVFEAYATEVDRERTRRANQTREFRAVLDQAYEALRIGLTACERYSRVYGWAGHDREINTMRDAFREAGRLLGKNGKVETGPDARGASDANPR